MYDSIDLGEIVREEKAKHEKLKQLSNAAKFEQLVENSPPLIVANINKAISDEALRLREMFGKEVLFKSDLIKYLHTSQEVVQSLFNDPSFPAIHFTEKKQGVTPFAFVLWSLTRSSMLDKIVSAYGKVMTQ